MMKKVIAMCVLVIGSLGLIQAAHAKNITISVNQFVQHDALDDTRQGLYDGLKQQGYVEGENLIFNYQTAHANTATAIQIARQYMSDKPDVMIGIGTQSAQAMASVSSSIPVVFTAVSDPIGAKLVKTLEFPEKNVTGMSAMTPIADHVRLLQELLPNIETIGVVYNSGEVNSVAQVELLKSVAKEANIEIIEASVANSSDVLLATKIVAKKADVIYAPTDNTIASAFQALISAANATKTPVFGGATFYVDKGAFASLGFSFYQLGEQTADYVVAIIHGTKPSQLPVKPAIGTDLILNQVAAQRLGIEFSEEIQRRAIRVITE
uniref:ABC transporter substrate-binding protein n=1 Tax=Aliivibrio wodanis TaxID=80852 RepID=A0A5Q4YYY0_9GAMM|nr:hypothetical protein AW0309160_03399 [Aliivibrio wodanis]